jgi:hypothetical protein
VVGAAAEALAVDPAADVLVLAVAAGDDALDEHPTISAATAATATPPTTMRARLSLDMVLTAPL